MTLPPTMSALQFQAIGKLEQVTLPVPMPKPDELLIRTAATTICTSDINDIARNPFNITLPIVLGHEGAGTVAAMGSEVAGFQVGDRVATHPVMHCGKCAACASGVSHLCDNMGHLGYDRDGTFAEFYRIRADRARHIPDGVDFATAALVEPIAVCIEALQRGRVAAGERVLVAGDGPFGIIISRLCLGAGAKVILAGKEEFRLRQVPQAAQIYIDATSDVLSAVLDLSGGGIDIAILAVESDQAVKISIAALRPRGRLVIFANVADNITVDLSRVHIKELEILGACNDDNYFDDALAQLSNPGLRMQEMVTQRFGFAEWQTAFEYAAYRKNEALKVALTFAGE